jgi:hypothetical protein
MNTPVPCTEGKIRRQNSHYGLLATSGLQSIRYTSNGMTSWGRIMSNIPVEVRDFARQVLAECNLKVSTTLSRNPSVHEPILDHGLIDHLSAFAQPRRVGKDWTVVVETHWVGGFPFFDWDPEFKRREIADILVRVVFAGGGKVFRTKVALLQSKRLSTQEQQSDAGGSSWWWPNSSLMASDAEVSAQTRPRMYSFNEQSIYREIERGNDQYRAIKRFEQESGLNVYYLLYNPLQIPHEVQVPVLTETVTSPCIVGCRVVPSADLRRTLESVGGVMHPSYEMLQRGLGAPFTNESNKAGWKFEDFVIDRLFECKDGQILDEKKDVVLRRGYLRQYPMIASVSIWLNAPDGFNWSFDELPA